MLPKPGPAGFGYNPDQGLATFHVVCRVGQWRPKMKESIQQATLRRARDLAGGISFLARRIGVSADVLDAMMHGRQDTPAWIFLRAADYINEAEQIEVAPYFPPGRPGDKTAH